jgi:hypothetical protein
LNLLAFIKNSLIVLIIVYLLVLLPLQHIVGMHDWGKPELVKDAYSCDEQEYMHKCRLCFKTEYYKGSHEPDYENGVLYYDYISGYKYAIYKCLYCEAEVPRLAWD